MPRRFELPLGAEALTLRDEHTAGNTYLGLVLLGSGIC